MLHGEALGKLPTPPPPSTSRKDRSSFSPTFYSIFSLEKQHIAKHKLCKCFADFCQMHTPTSPKPLSGDRTPPPRLRSPEPAASPPRGKQGPASPTGGCVACSRTSCRWTRQHAHLSVYRPDRSHARPCVTILLQSSPYVLTVTQMRPRNELVIYPQSSCGDDFVMNSELVSRHDFRPPPLLGARP